MTTNFPEAPTAINIPDKSVTLADLSYLWRVDNTDWVAQRDADWLAFVKPIFKEHPKAEQKLLENYFKYGIKSEYYPEGAWFFLTPYNSTETLLKVMNSSVLAPGCRGNIINWFLTNFKRFSHCPWYRRHMEVFIEVYFSGVFTVVTEEKGNRISPSPTSWCLDYVSGGLEAINNNASWSHIYLCLDYFVSILPFAFRIRGRSNIVLGQLMQLVDEKLTQGDCEGELLTFLQTLKAREQAIWQAWDIGEQKIAAGIKAPRE